MFDSEISFLRSPQEPDLAWCGAFSDNAKASIVWLGGYNSDMQGTKTRYLHPRVAARGHNYIAFDYSGHGQSGGTLSERTVTDWRNDTLRIIDTVTRGPLILVGSSLGGWLAMLAALARPDRVAGLVLIAPAVDLSERLIWQLLTSEEQDAAVRNGFVNLPANSDGSPLQFTYAQIKDGRKWSLMDAPIRVTIPVRILQGEQDTSVPSAHTFLFAQLVEGSDLVLTLIKDGDHRLSRPQDLQRLESSVFELADSISEASPDLKSA